MSTSWLNMSRGWRKAMESVASRGPTQHEAQAEKRARQAEMLRLVESFMSRGMSEGEARALAKARLAFAEAA